MQRTLKLIIGDGWVALHRVVVRNSHRRWRLAGRSLLASLSVPRPRLTRRALRTLSRGLRERVGDVQERLRDRGFLLRAGCGVAAVLVLLIALRSTGSPATTPSMFANTVPLTASPTHPPATSSTGMLPSKPIRPRHRDGSRTPAAAHPQAHPVTAAPTSQSSHPTTSQTTTSGGVPRVSQSATTPATTGATPATTGATPAQAKHPATPAPSTAASRSGCGMNDVHCGASNLIYSDSQRDLVSAPAISLHVYRNLALRTSFGVITERFGVPMSRRQLETLFSIPSLQVLVRAQPRNLSCAYYLDTSRRTSDVFRLCFSRTVLLESKETLEPRSSSGLPFAETPVPTTPTTSTATPAPAAGVGQTQTTTTAPTTTTNTQVQTTASSTTPELGATVTAQGSQTTPATDSTTNSTTTSGQPTPGP